MIFTIFPERQDVVCTLAGEENRVIKIGKCVVRDKSNWTCSDVCFDHVMSDGDYRQVPANPTVSYTNGWEWWGINS